VPELAIRFTAELLEDAHTGTGLGHLGVVDDTQSRDQQRRAVVWASTLRGLLREAGEDYAEALSHADPKASADVLTRLNVALGRTIGKDTHSEAGAARCGRCGRRRTCRSSCGSARRAK